MSKTHYGSGANGRLGQDAAEDEVRDKPSQDCENTKKRRDVGEYNFRHERGHERILKVEVPLRLIREGPLVEEVEGLLRAEGKCNGDAEPCHFAGKSIRSLLNHQKPKVDKKI